MPDHNKLGVAGAKSIMGEFSGVEWGQVQP